MTDQRTKSVGFVVIGRNEGLRLEVCLRSVLAVSNRIIYADSASTDGSKALAERLGVQVVALAADGMLSAARGRNSGYRELRNRFPDCNAVQFLDGDCILDRQWVTTGLEFLRRHPKAAVVCGRRFEAYPDASIYNWMCDVEWDTPVGKAAACGGDALIRCAAFDEVGGYRDELQAGEEPEMTARMRAAGWEIWRIDAPMAEHDANIRSFRQWWRRTQRGGFGYAQVWTVTRTLPKRVYGRQLLSPMIWALGIPALCGLCAVMARDVRLLLLIPLIYGFQLLRIGLATPRPENRWARAGLIVLAKFPETIGIARFALSGGRQQVPEYKSQ